MSGAAEFHLARCGFAAAVTMFPGFARKMRQTLTFLATIENDFKTMKTLAVISILALLTISGAIYSDLILTADQQVASTMD